MLYSPLAQAHNTLPNLLFLSVDQSRNKEQVINRWPDLFPSFPFSNLANKVCEQDSMWRKITRSWQACMQRGMTTDLTSLLNDSLKLLPFFPLKTFMAEQNLWRWFWGHWVHLLPRLMAFGLKATFLSTNTCPLGTDFRAASSWTWVW